MLSALVELLSGLGINVSAWACAWARVLPTVTLVPALGARFLPAQARAALGIGLSFLLIPAVSDTFSSDALSRRPLAVSWLFELWLGMPVALTAAATLWGVAMAGGLIDDLRGASQGSHSLFADAPTPTATLLALFACAAFLKLGGLEAWISVLSGLDPTRSTASVWWRVIEQLLGGIQVGFALAAPLLIASMVIDATAALVARAASPASIQALTSPLRAFTLLVTLAWMLVGLLRATGDVVRVP